MLACLVACSDEQAPATAAPEVSPDSGFAIETTESAPSVTIGGEQTLQRWQPPEIEVTADDVKQLRAKAAKALEQGRLFGQPDDAIPLYLALREHAPEDVEIRKGLDASFAALLEQGRQAVATIDSDPAQWSRAHDIAAVARTIDPDADALQAFLGELDDRDEIHALLVTGQRELRAGRVGEEGQGALAAYRKVLKLHPDNVRAQQGLAAAESVLIERAEQAAKKSQFEAAERWLDFAGEARDDQALVDAARKRVAAARAAKIWQLRDLGIAALTRNDGLADARRRLDELLRIAEPGNAAATELRKRIDLAAHYGLYRPGQTFTDPLSNGGRGPAMVVVPHGGFRMGAPEDEKGGSDAERPQHYVRFDRGFAMARSEITVEQFRHFIQATDYETRAQQREFSTVYDERRGNMVKHSGVNWRHDYTGALAAGDLPVIHVSARDAEAYAKWLSQQTGEDYRLPSEAEYEYAQRAGSEARFTWGDGAPPVAAGNFTGSGDVSPSGRHWRNAFQGYSDGYWGPAPVASFAANAYGLHDLDGNVSEWVADCWHEGYRRAPDDGRAWINPGCRTRILRGGSWASAPAQTRSAWRLAADADTTNARLGFRVVREI